MVEIHGGCEPRSAPVKDAFAAILAKNGAVGSAFALSGALDHGL